MSNIILTNISQLRLKAKFRNYCAGSMGMIKGRYTNEAPVKYLLKTVHQHSLDNACTVIAITTREAEEAFRAFRKTIRRYCKANGFEGIQIKRVTFAERRFGSVIADIIQTAQRGDKVFIDTTGGFRDSVYLLMAVVRILEYSGIRLEKAIYSVYNEKTPRENRIVDITETYNMFNLINAANSFTSLGNSEELAQFFADCSNSDIRRIIDVMNRFSDEVALCRTSKLDGLISELNDALISLQNLNSSDENEILFTSISGVIRDKIGVEDERSIDYLDVIRWCLDNKMIQQAVTIYVEKMPEFIFSKGLISFRTELLDDTNFNINFDIHYNRLYNGFLQQSSSITRSPYPIGNLLLRLKKEQPMVYKELYTIQDINHFSIKDKLTADERKGILNLIRIKNALFSEPNTKRPAAEVEERKTNPKLQAFADTDLFETAATCTEAFVNALTNKKGSFKMLQGEFTPYTPRVWNMPDINVLEHLERVLQENKPMYTISKKISPNEMKNVLMDLIYVKRYVRNAMNHASEENRLADEYDAYFGGKGYGVSAELSVKEIESVIRRAIDRIRLRT